MISLASHNQRVSNCCGIKGKEYMDIIKEEDYNTVMRYGKGGHWTCDLGNANRTVVRFYFLSGYTLFAY